MGNRRSKNIYCTENSEDKMCSEVISVEDFQFHGSFEEEDSNNGLFFNNVFLPDEILLKILSFVPPSQLLHLTLVCKKWCNIIKSEILWMEIYNKDHILKAKLLPWYVYYLYYNTDYFKNILKNGNGQNGFDHWEIIKNLGDEFTIEDPPHGSDPLPQSTSDFNGHTSCFATSYYECNKIQKIDLEDKRLLRYVMNIYTPHIYVSEWVAARFDCGCIYRLNFTGFGETYNQKNDHYFSEEQEEEDEDECGHALFELEREVTFQQWAGKAWHKVEILVEDYPKNVKILVFDHEGRDTQFWKGHYGSKMAGGIVRFIFDSIKPK